MDTEPKNKPHYRIAILYTDGRREEVFADAIPPPIAAPGVFSYSKDGNWIDVRGYSDIEHYLVQGGCDCPACAQKNQ